MLNHLTLVAITAMKWLDFGRGRFHVRPAFVPSDNPTCFECSFADSVAGNQNNFAASLLVWRFSTFRISKSHQPVFFEPEPFN